VTGRFNAHTAEAYLIFADQALFVGDAVSSSRTSASASSTATLIRRRLLPRRAGVRSGN
jgi:hypothetical protein